MKVKATFLALAALSAAACSNPAMPDLNDHDTFCLTQGIEPYRDKPGMVYWDNYSGKLGSGLVYPGCGPSWDKAGKR